MISSLLIVRSEISSTWKKNSENLTSVVICREIIYDKRIKYISDKKTGRVRARQEMC